MCICSGERECEIKSKVQTPGIEYPETRRKEELSHKVKRREKAGKLNKEFEESWSSFF